MYAGDVTGDLVYVNYGVPADYEVLERNGIDVAHIIRGKWAEPQRSLREHAASFRTGFWATRAEYWHMSLNNLALFAAWGLMAAWMGPLLFFPVCSPGLFNQLPLKHPRDLARHRCVNYFSAKTGKIYDWDFNRDGERIEVPMPGVIALNDSNAYVQAGLAGLGVIQMTDYLLHKHVGEGRMTVVQSQPAERIRIRCFDGTEKIILNSALPVRDAPEAEHGSRGTHSDHRPHVGLPAQVRRPASSGCSPVPRRSGPRS